MSKKKSRNVLPILLIVAGIGAVAWYGAGPGQWFQSSAVEVVNGAEVRRGPLRISVTQRGNLSARNSARLRSEIEGRTQILWLEREGAIVEAGDIVAELDAAPLVDRKVQQEINVQNAQAQLTKAQQQKEIQESQNASDIAKAEQDLAFAELEERKYLEGDWPQNLQVADEEIILAKEQVAQAEDRLEWSKRLEADGFLTRTRLEEDEYAFESAKIRKERADRALTLLQEFDHPKETTRLRAAVEEAERELERVRLQAKARLVDFEAEVATSTAKLSLETEQLEKLDAQINAATLRAPAAGMVVYGREESRWGQADPIGEGTEVRERQEIVTIPRTGGMIVEASLHETVIKKVAPGQRCIVRVMSLPGQEFHGEVLMVSQMADQGSRWVNPDLRVYRTEISIENGSIEMRPGMSCSVEIVVDEIEDTIYAPVQAIFYHQGKTICFLDEDGEPVQREVQVGQSSEKWAQILEGLDEGDTVHLSPPQDFEPEAAPAEPSVEPAAGGSERGGNRGGREGRGGGERGGTASPVRGEGEGGVDPKKLRGSDGEGFDPSQFRGADGKFDPEKLREVMGEDFDPSKYQRGGGQGGGRGAGNRPEGSGDGAVGRREGATGTQAPGKAAPGARGSQAPSTDSPAGSQ